MNTEEGARGAARARGATEWSPTEIATRAAQLGEWFHNLNLGGVQTAPGHFLGDFPSSKWRRFAHVIPSDLTGKTVLDVGCNAGFYSFRMKERGAARVVGIDEEEMYLEQARFAARVLGHDIEFRELSVYDVAELGETFDIVVFMGVLYHLRYPMLALDLLREHAVRDVMVFQSMLRGSPDGFAAPADAPFVEERYFDAPAYPKLHFVEQSYAGDPTNWWIPNRSCAEAMLRAAGFDVGETPERDVYLCRARPLGRSNSPLPAALRQGQERRRSR